MRKLDHHSSSVTVNADGRIEWAEFVKTMIEEKDSAENEEKSLLSAFRIFDQNKDGFICHQEMKKVKTLP